MTTNNNLLNISKPYADVEFENINKCVHCGLCLDACPTYRETGLEQASPRGRLYIMKGMWNGELEINNETRFHLDTCLDCRACETACPSQVPYGELIEKTRGVLHDTIPQPLLKRTIQSFFFRNVLPSSLMLKLFSSFFTLWQYLRIDKLLTAPIIKKFLPQFIVKGQYMLPRFTFKSFKNTKQGVHESLSHDKKIKNEKYVAMFTGCIADVSDREVQSSVLKLLRKAGCKVYIPKNQICCGALQVHGGDRKTGRKVAMKNLEIFDNDEIQTIITSAGGCSAQLKEYHHLFSSNKLSDETKTAFKNFESRITDITEYLSLQTQFVRENSWNDESVSILYDAPCHLLHAQKIDKNPRRLLSSLPGVTLVALDESENCCGSAGIYNLQQPEMADKVLDRKIESIKRALNQYPQTKILLTGNPGCQFQIRYGLKKYNIAIDVMHPAVFIARRLR